MASKQGEIRVNNIKREQHLVKERKTRDVTITKLKADLVDRNDTISALENENGILTAKLEKHDTAQKNGYLAIAVNKDGMIVNIAEVQGYSEYTFIQDVPSVYYHKNYKRYPVLELHEGFIKTNNQKLIKNKTLGVM